MKFLASMSWSMPRAVYEVLCQQDSDALEGVPERCAADNFGLRRFAWQDAPVDAPVSSLVDALNAVPHVSTYASCGGHRLRDGHGLWTPATMPYVAFYGQVSFARLLERALRDIEDGDCPRSYRWSVQVGFDDRHDLIFGIYAASVPFHRWSRRRLDDDLARIRRLVELTDQRTDKEEATAGRRSGS